MRLPGTPGDRIAAVLAPILLVLSATTSTPASLSAAQGMPGAVAAEASSAEDLLLNRLEAARSSGGGQVQGRPLLARTALQSVYLDGGYRFLWSTAPGAVAPAADSLRAVLSGAGRHGLEPEDYGLSLLEELAARVRSRPTDEAARVDLDLLLTDAFLVYGSHLLLGRVDPIRIEPEWIANRRSADLPGALSRALGAGDIRGVLEGELAPRQTEYARLQMALGTLVRAREAGGWPAVGAGPALREGDEGPRVAALRRRLTFSTDPAERSWAREGEEEPETFDPTLARAVQGFQERHGLEADGVVGAATVEALDVPVEARIRQVRVNLERWRWLPDDLGRRHIRVNIAAFETEVWNDGSVALHLRSIVGRQYRMTPSFTGSMRYLVLAPYWHVPPRIAAVDKLPEIQKDPGYLARQRFSLLDAGTNAPVDPSTVDWAATSGPSFNAHYRLRQDPGPLNALGNVKFMFPNRHNVYLHDTPQRELFARTRRDFSSGCIRVENPLELARYLLSADPSWTPERIQRVVNGGVEQTVLLPEPVPVHLLYLTAFVEEDGRVHFRSDLYGRDVTVLGALEADPPGD